MVDEFDLLCASRFLSPCGHIFYSFRLVHFSVILLALIDTVNNKNTPPTIFFLSVCMSVVRVTRLHVHCAVDLDRRRPSSLRCYVLPAITYSNCSVVLHITTTSIVQVPYILAAINAFSFLNLASEFRVGGLAQIPEVSPQYLVGVWIEGHRLRWPCVQKF